MPLFLFLDMARFINSDLICECGKLLLLTILFLWPSLYNGFPLVYSDTGTYIGSGLSLYVPNDRPISYGLFILFTSFKSSLWGPVFVQSFIFSFVYHRLMTDVLRVTNFRHEVGMTILVVSLSGIAWYCSQLMPDVWIAISILVLTVMLFSKRMHWYYPVILAMGIAMHNSHLAVIVTAILVIYLFKSRLPILAMHSFKMPLIGLLLGAFTMLFLNVGFDNEWRLTTGGSVFLTARLLDTGLLQSFLDEKCERKEYPFCSYRNNLPSSSREFLWDAGSPLNILDAWDSKSDICQELVIDLLTTPSYLMRFIGQNILASISQLTQIGVGSGLVSEWYQSSSSPPYSEISKHFPHSIKPYLQSRQNINLWGQGLSFKYINMLNALAFLISLLMITLFWTKLSSPAIQAFTLIFLCLTINAIVIASFANIYDRLQGRVNWFIILIGIFILFRMVFPPPAGQESK